MVEINGAYDSKMNQVLTEAITSWWSGLSKEELLQYLQEQPAVTADMLRSMLANEQVTMGLGVQFSVNNLCATADFHNAE